MEDPTTPLKSQLFDLSSPSTPNHLKEDQDHDDGHGFNQEFMDFLSSLPKERGIIVPHTYQYNGFWCPPLQLQGVLALQQRFQPKDIDVLLVTTPKSGTTWLKGIMFAVLNRTIHHLEHSNHPLLTRNPHSLVAFIELKQSENSFTSYPDCSKFFSTHVPLVNLPKFVMDDSSACKIVYLCRDVKDTFVSLWHFANKADMRQSIISLEEAFDLFCKGVNSCGPIWDHILDYWKESLEKPHKVLFMKYEEMKELPGVQVRRLANFLGCPISQEEENSGLVDQILSLCSFESLTILDVNKTGKSVSGTNNRLFFRKGEIGDWKNYLTPEMAAKLDQISYQKFHASGLVL